MNRFIFRLGLFSAIVFLLIYFLGFEMEKKDYTSFYMAAMADKHNRLDQIVGSRIIFAGGSATSFGVNSKEIELAFKIPVTNLGMMAGLGLDFMLKEIEVNMREGDIIILSPEYYLDINGSYEFKLYTAKCFPGALSYFRQDYIKNFTTIKFKQIKDNFNYSIDRILKRNQAVPDTSTHFTAAFTHRTDFNEYGDMIGHIGKRPPRRLHKEPIPYHYYEGIPRLNKFYERAKEKNVKVVFVYHAYAQSVQKLNKETIKKYQSDLAKDLKIPIIGLPDDFVYNDSLFFDTVYHLNPEGRDLRTKKLIQLLTNAHIVISH